MLATIRRDRRRLWCGGAVILIGCACLMFVTLVGAITIDSPWRAGALLLFFALSGKTFAQHLSFMHAHSAELDAIAAGVAAIARERAQHDAEQRRGDAR